MMYVANVSDDGFAENPLLDKVFIHAKRCNIPVVVVCASMEFENIRFDRRGAEFVSERYRCRRARTVQIYKRGL